MEKTKNKKIFWLVALVVILLVTAVYFIFMIKKNISSNSSKASAENYVIPGVPYFGLFNHIGDAARTSGNFAGGDSCAGVLDILEYWNPGQNDYAYVCNALKENSHADGGIPYISLNTFKNVFVANGFSVKTENISLADLGKYINSQVRTPLIFSLPLSVDQPDTAKFYPLNVLIGVDEKNQELTFHSYWLGNNYQMSFADFNKLEEKVNPSQGGGYLVIQPNDLNRKLKEIHARKNEAYPARTAVMQNGAQMFKDYAIGSAGAFRAGLWPEALDYLSKVESSPQFNDWFPPYLKTALYYQMAKMYFLKGDLDNSLGYAQKAVAEDHDLDKPFKDWPGYETNYVRPDQPGIIPEPYMVLGDVLDINGDLNGALQAYKTASDMSLNDNSIRASIQNVELEMAQKKASTAK